MNRTELFENYQKACNDYLHAFCDKHDFPYEEDSWIANQPGTIAMVGDFFVGMDTIVTDINEDAPEEEFFKWYDWLMDKDFNMTFSTWLKKDSISNGDNINLAEKIQDFNDLLKECIERDNPQF